MKQRLNSLFATLLCGVLLSLVSTGIAAEEGAAPKTRTAVFAGGCFWCVQPPFDKTPGVLKTVVGYAGGSEENPTYKAVSAGRTSHREAIEVTYDPSKVRYEELVKIFWRQIDPTQADGQFADIGHQYTTAIFYGDTEQKAAAEKSKQELEASGKFDKPIATEIVAAGTFWPAEEYHQSYYKKNPKHYKAYKIGSGRAGYIKRVWGED
jgi:methionine-S-sulfoxide reductase